ncbi:hypothetical protein MOLA814_00656 [Betaproteobacteria bacterium MOLA814]|nr:hypothetical protein MOLA814_00656 [Betaproteobacteria bacterium MOLA814]
MIEAIYKLKDKLLGRGDAAITVPVFDGALKPNNLLEDAAVFASLKSAQDLATDGQNLFVADGQRVLRYDADIAHELHHFEQPVTALACLLEGGLAVALAGREVRIVGGPHDGRQWTSIDGVAFSAVNAISLGSSGKLLVTDGSAEQPAENWKHDLMSRGATGRVCELTLSDGSLRTLATGLSHAFGVCNADGATWVSESWRHRVMSINAGERPTPVTDSLPGYPSRLSPASGGGYWLTCFILRTQLVEFVLREHTFRKRMMAEIEPQYWIAPALNSGNTFLEPMQGAHLKMMGVVKPWAPPRSYGLVIRLNASGDIVYSMHSRFDGKNHGVVAAVECQGHLYVLAKGCTSILRLSIADAERSLQA